MEQAADLLKVSLCTLYDRVRRGLVPGAKVGKRWVFIEVDLLDYIRGQYTVAVPPKELPCHSTSRKALKTGTSILLARRVEAFDDLLEQVIKGKHRSPVPRSQLECMDRLCGILVGRALFRERFQKRTMHRAANLQ
jgi:hypothetical protein